MKCLAESRWVELIPKPEDTVLLQYYYNHAAALTFSWKHDGNKNQKTTSTVIKTSHRKIYFQFVFYSRYTHTETVCQTIHNGRSDDVLS